MSKNSDVFNARVEIYLVFTKKKKSKKKFFIFIGYINVKPTEKGGA